MVESKSSDIVELILNQADRLARRLIPGMPKDILEMDITMPQLKILILLFIRGPMRMSAISNDLKITMATATSLVDRLVERQYVLRESLPDDRRVVLCRLSESGNEIVSRLWKSIRLKCRELLEAMDPVYLNKVVEVLNEMMNAAEYVSVKSGIKNG